MNLKTEKNTIAMGHKVTAAANAHFGDRKSSTIFEHGQWWIVRDDGSQYAVVDAEGPGSTQGFDFECVKEAEDF